MTAQVRTVVVAPVAAPYREPLFRALAERPELHFNVIYQAEEQPSWDVPRGYFKTEHGYPAQHLRSLQLARPGRTPVLWPRGLERALAEADPDVVVVSEYGPTALRALAWARRRGRRHVILTECTPRIDALLPAPQLALHRRMAREVDGAIAVSSQARQRLLNFGVDPEYITVALQSADLEAIRTARQQPRPHNIPLRLLTVARLVPDKNIALLLRAARQCDTPVAVDVVGDGFLRPRLQELADELELDVSFHGHLSAEDLAERYAAADVFALLSAFEPFGVVVREAAAAGLPLLVSDTVGAVGDVALAGENAVVVEPGALSAATVALERLLSDVGLRRQLGSGSLAVDARTAGGDVDAFSAAVLSAAGLEAPAPAAS